MITLLRNSFNASYTEEKYIRLRKRLESTCGVPIGFRVSETPVFIPQKLLDAMQAAGAEIIAQLMENNRFLRESALAIPEGFRVAGESAHPLFISVDFGITRDADGTLVPRLIELQGFPTLYAYQGIAARQYIEVYELDRRLEYLLNGLDPDRYEALFRKAVLGECDPDEVVLMELDPELQKTRPDFILTERMCGIRTVNVRNVYADHGKLYHRVDGVAVPIRRIYNRVIADELVKSGVALSFSFEDDLQVEWAGHPNWFFRFSKIALPFLDHPVVPETRFLDGGIPDDLSGFVLKPLFSFAGSGITVSPTRAEVDNIPHDQRHHYVLQEKIDYAGSVETPYGGTKVEVRIMYIWIDELLPENNLVRMGRGSMMGVSFNKDLAWVGSSAGLHITSDGDA